MYEVQDRGVKIRDFDCVIHGLGLGCEGLGIRAQS
jgi:hypothetical protein